jgi:hypothetical protein
VTLQVAKVTNLESSVNGNPALTGVERLEKSSITGPEKHRLVRQRVVIEPTISRRSPLVIACASMS